MELTRKQLESLKKGYKDGATLEELLNRFPDGELFIIMGWDRYSRDSYVKDVYFHKVRAQEEMAQIPPNGTPDMCDRFHIVNASFHEFQKKTIKDGNVNLDHIHLKILSNFLKETIEELD